MKPKHQSDEHNQVGANNFQHSIKIFWVCWLSPTWYKVDYSQLMSQFDCYQLQLVYLTLENYPVRNLQQYFAHHFWHVRSVTAPPHTALFFFFLHFSCAFTFHEVVKHNMMKMLLFLSSSILKELHKNSPILGGAGSEIEKDSFVSLPGKWRHIRLLPRKTVSQKVANFDKFFKNCTLRWQLSQYNLIKLFRMKFKTTKLYYIRLMEKPKWTFWTTQKNFTGANFPFKTSFAASQKFQFIVFLFSVASRL